MNLKNADAAKMRQKEKETKNKNADGWKNKKSVKGVT